MTQRALLAASLCPAEMGEEKIVDRATVKA
jgi:hypothetical protein